MSRAEECRFTSSIILTFWLLPDLKNHFEFDVKRVPCFGRSMVGRKSVALQSLVIQGGSVLSLEFVRSVDVGL